MHIGRAFVLIAGWLRRQKEERNTGRLPTLSLFVRSVGESSTDRTAKSDGPKVGLDFVARNVRGYGLGGIMGLGKTPFAQIVGNGSAGSCLISAIVVNQ